MAFITAGLVAIAVAACGETRRPPAPLTVTEVLERPARLQAASVRGRAFPVGATQFVLSGSERSVWVFAPPAVVRGVRPGQAVVVTGSVKRIEQDQAVELADEIARLSPARGPRAAARRPVEVLRARRNQGAPYIDLRRLAAPSG
ncbi:MAG TPA: hypothetical protein VGV57_09825 [Thermoleophilaceae bacterium]|nr:hypothetical protein [Thermoleophilaceae bacterium]